MLTGLVYLNHLTKLPVTYSAPANNIIYVSSKDEIVAQVDPVRLVSEPVGLDRTVQAATTDASNKLSLVDGIAEYVTGEGFNIATGTGYIYGHNRSYELAQITKLRPGDTVNIYGSDGKKYIYTMVSSEIVPETAFEKIREAADKHKLVLQTCVGFGWHQRLLVSLKLTGVVA